MRMINGAFQEFDLSENIPENIYYYQSNIEKYTGSDKILFLAGKGKKYAVLLGFENNLSSPLFMQFNQYENTLDEYKDSSLELKEKSKIYSAENLGNIEPDTPWVDELTPNS